MDEYERLLEEGEGYEEDGFEDEMERGMFLDRAMDGMWKVCSNHHKLRIGNEKLGH